MKCFEIPNLRFSLPSVGAVERNRFVGVDANGNGVQAGDGAVIIGASMNKVAANQVLEIADGIVIVTAGGTVAAGAQVQSDAAGKAITLASGKLAGVAITGGASGSLITIKI